MMRWLRVSARQGGRRRPEPPAPVQPKVPALPCAYIGAGCVEPGLIPVAGWMVCTGHAHELAMRPSRWARR